MSLWHCAAFVCVLMALASDALARLGRKAYISQSGLATLLTELKAIGGLPAVTSRSSIKRSRDREADRVTRYGNVMQELRIDVNGDAVAFDYVHPIAFLEYAAGHCDAFSKELEQCVDDDPPSWDSPWDIIVYSDEVTPGDAKKARNHKRLEAVYWSFKQFGQARLSSEHLWFILAAIRSETIRDEVEGGMSTIFKHLLALFHNSATDIRHGVFITTKSGRRVLFFAKISIMVSDAAALQMVLGVKGTSGNLLCLNCRNCSPHKPKNGVVLHEADTSGFLVPSTETDLSRFIPQTDDTLFAAVDLLAARRPLMGNTAFERLESDLGVNHIPAGLLLCPFMRQRIQPISMVMWDWMHCYFASGIFQVQVTLLLLVMRRHGFRAHAVHEFMEDIVFPSHLGGSSPSAPGRLAFFNYDYAGGFNCQASEGLTLYSPFRMFLLSNVFPHTVAGDLRVAILAYIKLCVVLDMLVGFLQPGDAYEFARAIAAHLDAFQLAHGTDEWVPKFHLVSHLPELLLRFGMLFACFVHERKHKALKKFANNLDNVCRAWERSIMQDALYSQLHSLADDDEISKDAPCLYKPRRPPLHILELVRDTFNLDLATPVNASHTAAYAPGAKCSNADVVVMELAEGGCAIGEVICHVEVLGEYMTIVSLWEQQGNNNFRRCDRPRVVCTTDIRATCAYKVVDDANDIVLVIPPSRVVRG